MRLSSIWLVAAALSLLPASARATFHFMQIEQVIGGAYGDTSAQAIQLRMRTSGQNFVSSARIVVRDAAGANPVVLEDMTTDVANGQGGRRILLTTPAFANYTSIPLVTDFVMDPIPASYLAAGSLTFEDDFGTIWWRLSWGGAAYTGEGTLAPTNDADGDANPPFAGPLQSATLQAVQFTGAIAAASTSNSLQYVVTAGAATFINNAGTSFTLVGEPPPPVPLASDRARFLLGLGLALVLLTQIQRRTRAR